ncbi:hypothetical protein RB213_012181, partial [Colletotrichum asianum]
IRIHSEFASSQPASQKGKKELLRLKPLTIAAYIQECRLYKRFHSLWELAPYGVVGDPEPPHLTLPGHSAGDGNDPANNLNNIGP